MQKQNLYSVLLAVLLILAAALSRVIMYPHNFSPMIGMAVFAGAVIKDRKLAFALPIFSMFLSDLIFEVFHIAPGFWGWGQLANYGIFALITIIAFTLKRISVVRVAGYAVFSSLLFFVLSNLSVFLLDNQVYHLYPNTFDGLIKCYAAGLPFLRISLAADLVYSGVLFGAYYLINTYAFKKAAA
ncbi:MAG: DUF6580 family putative transport protein [Ferruginibacter sp.]